MAEVKLTENQSAEPGKCGSCKFYDRGTRTDWVGRCRVQLPPWLYDCITYSNVENGPDTGLADTMSCDLYKPSGDTYIQEKRWKV